MFKTMGVCLMLASSMVSAKGIPLNCDGMTVTIKAAFIDEGEQYASRDNRLKKMRESLVMEIPVMGYIGVYKGRSQDKKRVYFGDLLGNSSVFVTDENKRYYVRIGNSDRNIPCNEM